MEIVNNFLAVDKIMDNSPRRSSSSFNLDLSDLLVGLSYCSTSSLIASRKLFRSSGVTSEMSHSLSINDAITYPIIPKKDSNILQSMINALGSFTNIISKIPNYMSNINNTLSVTVIPNGGIISSEYILKNLTQSREHLTTYIESSTNILKRIKKNTLHDELHSMEMEFPAVQQRNFTLNEKSLDVFGIRSATWMDSVHDIRIDKQHNNTTSLTNDLEIVFNESMSQVKCMKYTTEITDICNSKDIPHRTNMMEKLKLTEINNDMSKNHILDYLRKEVQERTTGGISKINHHPLDKNEITSTESDESTDMEKLIKKPLLSKICRKSNMNARNRVKSRGKLQLRKSGVSQLKHRKERSKQIVYCSIRNDLNAWEEVQQDFSEGLGNDTNIATSSTISNYCRNKKIIVEDQIEDPGYSRMIETVPLHHHPKSIQRRRETLFNTPYQSPSDNVSDTYNFRSRCPSECSIDSEDGCLIIFQNESETDCADYDYKSTSSDECENDQNDDQSRRRVRFILQPRIHMMIKWDFAYRAARRGPWEEVARDRERFRGRINCVGKVLNPILLLQHRERIYQNRFDVRDLSCEINWIE